MRAAVARGVGAAIALGAVVLGACAELPAEEEEADTIDVRRVESRVEVRRARDGVETFRIDVDAGDRVTLAAAAEGLVLSIDAVPTGPGVPITAIVRAGAPEVVLEIRNDLVTIDDVTYRLAVAAERDLVVAALAAGPIGPALRAVAPYRVAIESRLAESGPLFAAVGLFQAWPGGVEPVWPALDDPRDVTPPGHLPGDLVGLGMTCSTAIRCPNSAPYCVTVDHEVTYGVCTRACAADAACGGLGRCAQPVIDIPDVTGAVLTCEVECAAGACPGLLACEPARSVCEARQDH